KILLSKNNLSPHKVSVAYLCNQTWKEWTAFIAMKYIDMGKAVYHFAIPNYADLKKQKNVVVGEVLSEFKNGITSFDYERIKADETVEREISRYITFAINNFATAVMKENERKKGNNEDVLAEKLKLDTLKDDVDRRILQYFGGKSTWTDYSFESNALFSAIQKELAYIRNNHFHYAGDGEDIQKETSSIIDEMFQKEYFELGMKYRKKYYSNNVPKFYSVENITALMDRLYDAPAIRPAQVPSFQKVLSRNTFKAEIGNFVKGKPLGKVSKIPEMAEEFRSSLYFVLKEIYYYDFLQLKDLKTRFMEALKIINDNERDKTKQKAMKNFMERINEIEEENITFGQLCQQIMTDYEQQNNEKEKKASGYAVMYMDKNENLVVKLKKTEDDKKIYKHFKSLLYIGLKEAFWHYLNPKGKDETEERFFQFLREPINRQQEFENLSEEIFCSDWESHTYDNIQENGNTLAWFTVAHFLNPKQLNHLIGCIKNYIQYIENINRRAKAVENRTDSNISKKIGYYRDILIMLDFCMPFCGQISNVLEDYYKDADDYAEHLAKYVNFTSKKLTGKAALQAFSNKSVKIEKQEFRYGIYFDGLKPIINRNVVMAMLYGAESVLANSISPITENDLKNYYKNKLKLSELFKSGVCKTEADYQELREFQNLKNRVELVDIMIFSEILSDLMGQLIGFAYLRERDLMYMQLGFQYVKLFHTESIEKHSLYKKLNGSQISIMDGAILYQIVAMYSYHLPIFILDENGNTKIGKENAGIGIKIPIFVKLYGDPIYDEGLCFFEDIHMHEYIIEFRNYIDHFKYYAKTNKSMLDMYSQMYDSFFDYDLKLKKSVSFVLSNVLMKYFIVPKLSFAKTGEKSYKPERNKEKITKKATKITIDDLNSDIFTFNIPMEKGKEQNHSSKKKEVVLAQARSKMFLTQVMNMLEFSK
ncbi:MAG: type VI-A CRISPR-associated RNA-guided ribonuclease Cas13a, partial [Lachnospiraceae bacterium]|nr:type VI-A CRISPR-associated RNA-guided ribonuclease Cas13a [Lachnospiraceae bacterium]